MSRRFRGRDNEDFVSIEELMRPHEPSPTGPRLVELHVVIKRNLDKLRELYKESFIIQRIGMTAELDPGSTFTSVPEVNLLRLIDEQLKELEGEPKADLDDWLYNYNEKYKEAYEKRVDIKQRLKKIEELLIELSKYSNSFIIYEVVREVKRAINDLFFLPYAKSCLTSLKEKLYEDKLDVRRQLGYPLIGRIDNLQAGMIWANRLRGVCNSARQAFLLGYQWLLDQYPELSNLLDYLEGSATRLYKYFHKLAEELDPIYSTIISTETGVIKWIVPIGTIVHDYKTVVSIEKEDDKEVQLQPFTLTEKVESIDFKDFKCECGKGLQPARGKLPSKLRCSCGKEYPTKDGKIIRTTKVFTRLEGVWVVNENLDPGVHVKPGDIIARLSAIPIDLILREQWGRVFHGLQSKIQSTIDLLDELRAEIEEGGIYGAPEGRGSPPPSSSNFQPPYPTRGIPPRALTVEEKRAHFHRWITSGQLKEPTRLEEVARRFDLTYDEALEAVTDLVKYGYVRLEGARRFAVLTPIPAPLLRRGTLVVDPKCPVCQPLLSIKPLDEDGLTYRIEKKGGKYVAPFMQALEDFERLSGIKVDIVNYRTDPERFIGRYGKEEPGLPILIIPGRVIRAPRPGLTKEQYLNMMLGKEPVVKAEFKTPLES